MKADKNAIKRIVVTGKSGFVGQNLWEAWSDKYDLHSASFSNSSVESIPVSNGDIVIHLAGIAHQKKGTDPNLYYSINYQKSVDFAKRAKQQGASQFVFISTTKVYGVNVGTGITEMSSCHPTDDYGKSKLQAEQEIAALQDDTFTVAIIRPPLVYGPGVKGNMLKLLNLCASGKPLPFKGVNNERSIVYVGNLLAMLRQIVEQQKGGIFIPSDDQPFSTFSMLKLMKNLLGRTNLEVSIPAWMIYLLSKVKPELKDKIFGTLVYDNTQSKRILDFHNPYSTEEGFDEMVKWYKANYNK